VRRFRHPPHRGSSTDASATGEVNATTPRDYHRCMPLLDEFPSTHRTLLEQALEQGDIAFARRHVMARAYGPLCLYARASSLRSIAPAEELVGGFFASRFGRDDYLARWLATNPPLPLRRWLVNGLLLHAREYLAAERRARRAPTLAEPPLDIEPGPWRTLERAWRDGVLQASCDRVSELYAREGRTDAWRLFMRHIIDGVAYPALEAELAIPAASAPMITRTALRRLRAEINAILAEEFTDPAQRARELDAILFDDGDADA